MALNFHTSGIFAAPADRVSAIQSAERAGLRWVDFDAHGTQNKTALLQACAKAFSMPATFGLNWDALADALQDLSWLADGEKSNLKSNSYGFSGIAVWIAGLALWSDYDLVSAATFNAILQDSAEYWQRQGVRFIVLMSPGEGWPALPDDQSDDL